MIHIGRFIRNMLGRRAYYYCCSLLKSSKMEPRGLKADLFLAFTTLLLVSLYLTFLQLIYFPSLQSIQRKGESEVIKRPVKRCGNKEPCAGLSGTNLSDNRGLDQYPYSGGNQSFVKNIYYIKVHKSGSTTMQNILQRFAISHNLKVAVFNRPWTMPFPETADMGFLFEQIEPGSKFEKYNIMCDHAVFNESVSRTYMASNLTYIATLREPFSQLESSFEYFNLARGFKFDSNVSDPIYEFLTQGAHKFQHRRSFKWVQNIQALNMGYTNTSDNHPTSVQRYLSYLSKTLNFVILLEQVDASLIYMKQLFNWSLKDILYLVQLPSIKKDRVTRDLETTKKLQRLHRKVSTADYVIYDYFSRKTNTLLQNQPHQFWEEVQFFQTVLKQVKQFCSGICHHFSSNQNFSKMTKRKQIEYVITVMKTFFTVHETVWNERFKVTYGHCALMTFFTIDYNKALRVHQFKDSCNRKNSKTKPSSSSSAHMKRAIWYQSRLQSNVWCDRSQHVVQTFPYKVFKKEILDKCSL